MNNEKLINEINNLRIGDIDSLIIEDGKPVFQNHVAPTVFERDGLVFISAEDGKGFADYYGEYQATEAPYIHPELEAIAKNHGGYWEWENPGCIVFAN